MKYLLALLFLIAPTAWADVYLDASSGTQNDNGSIASVTLSHTTGSGSNRYLICGVGQSSDLTGGSNMTVTYNGTSMTSIGQAFKLFGSPAMELWGLVAPASGAHNVVVTFSGSSGNYATVECMSLRNVNQSTPVGTAVTDTADGTTTSQTVTTVPADMAVQFNYINTNSWTVDAGGIVPSGCTQYTFFGSNRMAFGIYKAATTTSTSLGASGSSNTIVRVSIQIQGDGSAPETTGLTGNFFL